ncbi:MAG: alpha/beta fold hydrolase [Caulobacter sp.]|nr:alpha/beta fold hydrolase [Caulobacter sp.]
MIRHLVAVLLAASGLALAAPAFAAKPEYRPSPCLGDLGADAARVSCGILVVDEARGTASTRRVAMPVVILKASAPRAGQPPVFYLQGGPGGAAAERATRLLRSPLARDMVAVDQDWVFFDERGSGLASPLLDCGAVAMNDAGPLSPGAADALKACAARHAAAGVDLSRYNEREVALDVQDLRQLLGYEQIDLFGASYGTSAAMAILRHAPQGIRAVGLDSPWPPEARWAQGGPQMVSGAVRLVIAKCQADTECNSRYPTLAADADALAVRFLAGPQQGQRRAYTADDLGGFLMDAAYDDGGSRRLSLDLEAMFKGDYSALEAHRAERSPYYEGQHLTHVCKEEFPFEDEAKVAEVGDDRIAALLVPSMTRYFDVCRAWPVGKPWPSDGVAMSSDIPTLFLAAEIDPGCPPELAKAAVARFSKGQLFIAPNVTHGVSFGSPCARGMVQDFFRDPTAPVDGKCLASETPTFEFDYGD